MLLALKPGLAQDRPERPGSTVIVLDITGAIGPATTDFVEHGLDIAAERQSVAVVLRMDTPGGLASSMRDIVQAILASPVPVIGYVAPSGARAASAGTYILYATHVAAMAPGTNLGAATPVQLGGEAQPLPDTRGGQDDDAAPADTMTSKVVNDSAAYIRSLAELRGRNADWAEAAVRRAESLSANAALDAGVIDFLADGVDDLLDQADGQTVQAAGQDVTLATAGRPTTVLEPNWRSRLLALVTDPNIAYVLMLVGIYGIILEFFHPGAVLPGTVGAISLIMALFALNMLPINYAGAALLILGIALMTAEAFVPSFGILGIGGAAAFAVGSFFMIEDVPGFGLSIWVIAAATAVSIGLFAIVIGAAVRAYRRKVTSGDAALIGAIGSVLVWSGDHGQIHVHGERWQARSSTPLAPGTPVRVKARDALLLTVEPASQIASEEHVS
ncbi:NfeD family protein [Consotaella aegiceratis]|uniref:NfeD family protein n=1 Tax=Consotaella aegiceratis TaxID=3097961 RepID=UPI003D803DD9